MARMFTDANAMSRKMDKEREFRGFVQSFVDRKIEELQHETCRDKWAQFFLEYLTIQKMYGIRVHELYEEMGEILRDIERTRRQRRDPNRQQADYEHFRRELERYESIRHDQATWLITVAQLLDDCKITYSDNQLQTALSIPVKVWERLEANGLSPFVGGYSA